MRQDLEMTIEDFSTQVENTTLVLITIKTTTKLRDMSMDSLVGSTLMDSNQRELGDTKQINQITMPA